MSSLAEFNGTVDPETWPQGLFSLTTCLRFDNHNRLCVLNALARFQMFYTRPRMYLFTYAYSDEDTNELYAEYHLSRQAPQQYYW